MTTPLTIRGLAKAHSAGEIDRQTYIRERRQLIDGIVAGEVELVPYVPPPLRESYIEEEDDAAGEDDAESTLELPKIDPHDETVPGIHVPSRPTPLMTTKRLILVGLAGLIFAIAATVIWMSKSEDPKKESDSAKASTDVQIAPTPLAANAADRLLLEFLKIKSWTATDINQLSEAWRHLRSDLRADASEATLKRVANAINRKLVEDSALVELGNAVDALARQRRLLDLAALLGIDDERLKRHERSWREHSSLSSRPLVTGVVIADR